MFKQIELNYQLNELEPSIDELTMITHYTKHHAAYTNNLNAALEKAAAFADRSIEYILNNLDQIEDPALRTALRNNGGGFYNHNLYFGTLSPKAEKAPSGALSEKILATFGSLDALKEKLTAAAASQFGSGWAWLSTNAAGDLQVSASPNQDNPLMASSEWTPILGIDVWEHAYYLKYKNVRADYLKAFWEVLDWAKVTALYSDLTK
jgi:Fe-Mn family superoxide dismutase